MVDSICHERFYTAGVHIDEQLGLYVGWTSIKGSFSDGGLFRNERGDVSVALSGEVYSPSESIAKLRQKGHAFEGNGASYLPHLYEEDPSFWTKLNGLFHGLVADRTQQTITLFNDRYGMHRLFFHEAEDSLYFAAEAKAILAVLPELRRPDERALGEFVALSCVLEDRTVFHGIEALPAGSAWIFRNRGLERKSKYFSPSDWENEENLDSEAYVEGLKSAFSGNLPLYFEGPGRVGIALTGGLDTRVIMACHPPAPGAISTFTFGGVYRDSQDVTIAREIAKLARQSHQVITVGDEFLSRFSHYAERTVFLTEGTVDVYRASDLYLSEVARRIAPIKVVGTYGSEILRQAVMFKPMGTDTALFTPEFLSAVHQAANTYAAVKRVHPVTFAAFRQSPWYHHGILALEQSQLTVRSPYLDNDFLKAVYRAPVQALFQEDVRFKLIRDNSPVLANIPTDRGMVAGKGSLLTGASHWLLEFTFKAEYAYDYGMPQWVARVDHQLSAFHLERLFLGRHKLLHYRVWYRDVLAKYVQDILLDPLTRSRQYLSAKRLEHIVQSHVRGERNYTLEIHKLLTLELLHRAFFDQPTGQAKYSNNLNWDVVVGSR